MKRWRVVPAVVVFSIVSARGALPLSWQVSDRLPAGCYLKAVTYGDGRFVAVGPGRTILTSENGLDWPLRTNGPVEDFLFSAAFGNGRFVAGGRLGALLAVSSDLGVTWTIGRAGSGIESVYGLTFGNGLFVGVGQGMNQDTAYILTSSNGFHWGFPSPPTTNALHAVTFANNRFVAVGERGTIVTSVNGTNWTTQNSGTPLMLRAVTHNGSRFIAAGDFGTVISSADGLSWAPAAPASFDIYALASGGGAVVAVGQRLGSGRLQVSPDGLTWPGDPDQFPNPLHGVAYRPDYFVAVGENSLVLRSSGFTPGAANFWTKPTSGNWTERFWSLGEPPDIVHPVIGFNNPGFKALAIDHATTVAQPDSLNIRNLVVDAPVDSSNLLLLNYAGLDTPLRVNELLRIGPRGVLLSYASWLIASNMIVDGHATFAEFGRSDVPRLSLGQSAPAELTLSNGWFQSLQQTVSVSYASALNQYDGTNYTRGLDLGEGGSYNLYGGTFTIEYQGTHPGVWLQGGQVTVGGGFFDGQVMFLNRGRFTQFGGTTIVYGIEFNATNSDVADVTLSGGTLVTANVNIGGRFGRENATGTFTVSGGFHTNMGSMFVGTNAHYSLSGGIAAIDEIGIGGTVEQTGGTNFSRVVTLINGGIFRFTGGQLTFERLWLDTGAAFYRRATFANQGTSFPGIHFSGGTFFAGSGSNQVGMLSIGYGDIFKSSVLDLERDGPSVLRFAEFFGSDYGTLLITNWAGSLAGGGADRIYVGTNENLITAAQLEKIGFSYPPGLPGGIYMAHVLPTGEIVPSLAHPQIRFTRLPDYLQLEWNGNFYDLYTATNILGPWESYSWAHSPAAFRSSDPQRYFRLRSR